MFPTNESLAAALARNVHDALMEDIGVCDWTAQLVPESRRVTARVLVREDAVLCGRDWFDARIAALSTHFNLEIYQDFKRGFF